MNSISPYKVVDLTCPGCGASVSTSARSCAYCGRDVVISSFSSVYSMSSQELNKYINSYKAVLSENPDHAVVNFSIAMCYLKLRLYDKALTCFERAIEDNFDNSETYFYAAACLLKGRKAFVVPIADIRKAENYLNAATTIENRGIYYYFLAYIKFDFYARKHLNVSPNYADEYNLAHKNAVTDADIQYLYEILGVTRPSCI